MRELVVLGVGAITILIGIYAVYRLRIIRSPVQRWDEHRAHRGLG